MEPLFQQTDELQHFFEQLYEKSLNPFWIAEVVENDFIIVIANPAAQRLEPEQKTGASIRRLAAKYGNPDMLLDGYYRAVLSGESIQFEQQPTVNGKEYLFRTLIVPIRNTEGKITHVWGSSHNLTDFLDPQKELLEINKLLDKKVRERTSQLNEAMADLERLAVTDDLTDIANRRYFDQQFRFAVDHANVSGEPLSMVYIDIDNFKQFNDRFGHSAGDKCLKQVAQVLARFFNDEKVLVARYGGEEFAVLLPNTAVNEAVLVAERLRKKVENTPFEYDVDGKRGQLALTVSLGVAEFSADYTSSQHWLEVVDKFLYQAKESGRNRVGWGS